jgi:hypothetical protein
VRSSPTGGPNAEPAPAATVHRKAARLRLLSQAPSRRPAGIRRWWESHPQRHSPGAPVPRRATPRPLRDASVTEMKRARVSNSSLCVPTCCFSVSCQRSPFPATRGPGRKLATPPRFSLIVGAICLKGSDRDHRICGGIRPHSLIVSEPFFRNHPAMGHNRRTARNMRTGGIIHGIYWEIARRIASPGLRQPGSRKEIGAA